MDLLKLLNERFTAKSYDKDKKVSDDDFMRIIEAARLSPSSFGFEPWRFIHLKNREVLDEILPYSWGAKASIENASHIVLILARTKNDLLPYSEYLNDLHTNTFKFDKELLERRYKTFDGFINNDFRLVESDRSMFDWASKQTYIALANMLNMAASLNIDSTPIEGFDQEKVHEILVKHNVYDPNHFKISLMLGLGYANKPPRAKVRQSIADVFEVK